MPDDVLRAQLEPSIADRYAIEREIGRGGMATVFLARDLKHQRVVAIKVLNPDLGAVLGAERFLSEIRVTANLQHPNLLPLFDSGEANGLLYYVMPFVEGESLRARLDREKQLPVDEAVHIATAVANALEYAHGHGVIHRDLKPENILLQSGQPVVADFGIALAVSNAGGTRVTQTGLSLGTPQYMSPEQATGDRVIDRRSDIYSLGAVTYEMLTGEPPHTGTTAQAIIARLMTEAPRSVSASRPSVPAHVDTAIHRALEKLPADRFGSAKEFADALDGRSTVVRSAGRDALPARHTRLLAPLGAVAGVLALASILSTVAWWRASHRETMPSMEFAIDAPDSSRIDDASSGASVAISRDGGLVAFTNARSHVIVLRRLDAIAPETYTRAPTGSDPHFSSDGKWIVFKAGTEITRVSTGAGDAASEATQVIPLRSWNGLSTEYGDEVVYASLDSLYRVPLAGGRPQFVAAMDSTQGHWQQPALLPDAKTIALRVTPQSGTYGTASDRLGLISIDGGTPTVLDLEFQNVVGFSDGILIYGVSAGRLMAVKLDVKHRKLAGDPVPVLDDVMFKQAGGVAAQMSDNGTLAYLRGSPMMSEEVIDAKGSVVATLPAGRLYSEPSLSPDGTRVAVSVEEAGGSDIWVYDIRTGVLTKVADHGSQPVWTPDGKRVAYLATSLGTKPTARWIASDGSTTSEAISGTDGLEARQIEFSPDGRYIILVAASQPHEPVFSGHAFAIPIGGGPRTPLATDSPSPSTPTVSPNGKWIAYGSVESGRSEIYVRSFPAGAGKVQISPDGGTEPRWTRDGTRLMYRHQGTLVAAALDIGGAMPRLVRRDTVFAGNWALLNGNTDYDMNGDATRFVRGRSVGDPKLVVITNWFASVKEKVNEK